MSPTGWDKEFHGEISESIATGECDAPKPNLGAQIQDAVPGRRTADLEFDCLSRAHQICQIYMHKLRKYYDSGYNAKCIRIQFLYVVSDRSDNDYDIPDAHLTVMDTVCCARVILHLQSRVPQLRRDK